MSICLCEKHWNWLEFVSWWCTVKSFANGSYTYNSPFNDVFKKGHFPLFEIKLINEINKFINEIKFM